MSFFGATDFYTEVAKGVVPGHKLITVAATNAAVGTSKLDLWGFSSDLVYPTAGETWEIVSSDANDTILGTGARTVEVPFLDDNHVYQIETLELDGTTPVTFASTSAFRPYPAIDVINGSRSIRAVTFGSSGTNAGNITISNSSGGAVRAYIPAANIISRQSHYTVEAGKSAFIVYGFTTVRKNKDVIISFERTDGTDGVFVDLFPIEIYQSAAQFNPHPLGPITEKTDTKTAAISTNASTEATFLLQLLVVDN